MGLTIEIWSANDRIIHGNTPLEERLLREAQYTFSGMIYGFDFVYTPEYAARGVDRFFELTPVAGIPWGDPRLTIRDIRDEQDTLYGLIDYTLSENDRRRLRSWQNIDVTHSSGSGNAPLLDGLNGKIKAIEEAVHSAIREYLRGRYTNRPREVIGSVVFERAPRIRTDAGMYVAQVDVYLHIREVREYRSF